MTTTTPQTVTVPTDAITTLTPPALQAYLYMLASDGKFSQRSAARDLSRSVDSIKRAIRELEGRGLIAVDRTTPWAPVYTVSRSMGTAKEPKKESSAPGTKA